MSDAGVGGCWSVTGGLLVAGDQCLGGPADVPGWRSGPQLCRARRSRPRRRAGRARVDGHLFGHACDDGGRDELAVVDAASQSRAAKEVATSSFAHGRRSFRRTTAAGHADAQGVHVATSGWGETPFRVLGWTEALAGRPQPDEHRAQHTPDRPLEGHGKRAQARGLPAPVAVEPLRKDHRRMRGAHDLQREGGVVGQVEASVREGPQVGSDDEAALAHGPGHREAVRAVLAEEGHVAGRLGIPGSPARFETRDANDFRRARRVAARAPVTGREDLALGRPRPQDLVRHHADGDHPSSVLQHGAHDMTISGGERRRVGDDQGRSWSDPLISERTIETADRVTAALKQLIPRGEAVAAGGMRGA